MADARHIGVIVVAWGMILLSATGASAIVEKDTPCLVCHETAAIQNKEARLKVERDPLQLSPHATVGCLACHPDAGPDGSASAAVTRPDHPVALAKATCLPCHEKADREQRTSSHGAAYAIDDPTAPTCVECHGAHAMQRVDDPSSPTHRTNAPRLCGRCHRVGEPIRRGEATDEGYPMAVHGAAFFGKGSVAAAACVDCHGGHTAYPRTNEASPIHPRNMATTCGKCHRKIDEIHATRIDPAFWRTEGAQAPCDTCHPPHDPRTVSTTRASIVNDSCLFCHGPSGVERLKTSGVVSPPYSDHAGAASPHQTLACDSCHIGIEKDHTQTERTAPPAQCGVCHITERRAYDAGWHGARGAEGRHVPTCATCHGTHDIAHHADPGSATRRDRIPELCGGCHGPERAMWEEKNGIPPPESVTDYTQGVHGHAVDTQGSTMAAICVDCHDSHRNLPREAMRSREGRMTLATQCGKCHAKIYDRYTASVHAVVGEVDGADRRPGCADCHHGHENRWVQGKAFRLEASQRCAPCHQKLASSYETTIHGKTMRLGMAAAAQCGDCHGAHGPIKVDDSASPLSPANRLATCQKCHPTAGVGFISYMAHADHTDQERSPFLYYVYRFMTGLLLSVFGFFGLHMLLWTPRSLYELLRRDRPVATGRYVRRFDKVSRITHGLVVVSFLLLAATGMALKFAWSPWADDLVSLFGGVAGAGLVHRIAAVVTFGYFILHLVTLAGRRKQRGESWIEFACGKNSMWFCAQDLLDLVATIRWFLWLGPRPVYGRFTYWEKFDYFAVFWGVPVIGLSGLALWFPELATRIIPGWGLNVAHLIHSDEALLAVGFIFLAHFFHVHFRPETFPMDIAIFTGLVPEESYRAERAREVDRMKADGTWDSFLADPPTATARKWSTVVGALGLVIGNIMMGLILWGLLYG